MNNDKEKANDKDNDHVSLKLFNTKKKLYKVAELLIEILVKSRFLVFHSAAIKKKTIYNKDFLTSEEVKRSKY